MNTETLDKIAKLLSLAKSSNPHEAALAASKAQDIMDRHRLTMADIELDGADTRASAREPIRTFNDPLDRRGDATWRAFLAKTIAELNGCGVYRSAGELMIYGGPSDANATRYLYTWLVREIERLVDEHCFGEGLRYWDAFRLGATDTVRKKLKAQFEETLKTVKAEAVSPHALAIIERNALARVERQDELARFAADTLRLRKGRAEQPVDGGARAHGQQAAQSINVGGKAALGAGRLRLQ